WEYLNDLAGATTACELLAKQTSPSAPSLGLIKPLVVEDLIIEPNDGFTEDKQRIAELAAAGDLFKDARAVLEPAPYRLKYRFVCESSGCRGHTQTLIDWEAGQAARAWLGKGTDPEALPALLREKFLNQLCAHGRDTYFFLGNQHLYPRSFL